MTIKKLTLIITVPYLLSFGFSCEIQKNQVVTNKSNIEIEVTEEEACIDTSKIDPYGVCTMDWDPVCGCDETTYSNSCAAERSGVITYEKGACVK